MFAKNTLWRVFFTSVFQITSGGYFSLSISKLPLEGIFSLSVSKLPLEGNFLFLFLNYLWRVDDEVAKGEAKAIVLSLDPELVGKQDVSFSKTFRTKTFTFHTFSSRSQAKRREPYLHTYYVCVGSGGRFSPLVEEGFWLRMRIRE